MRLFSRCGFYIMLNIGFGITARHKENKPVNDTVLRCVDCKARMSENGRVLESSNSETSSYADFVTQKESGTSGKKIARWNFKRLKYLLPWYNRNTSRTRRYIRKNFPVSSENRSISLGLNKIEHNSSISVNSDSDEIKFKVISDSNSNRKRIVKSTPLPKGVEQNSLIFSDSNSNALTSQIDSDQSSCIDRSMVTETEQISIDSRDKTDNERNSFLEPKDIRIRAQAICINKAKRSLFPEEKTKSCNFMRPRALDIDKPGFGEYMRSFYGKEYTNNSDNSSPKKMRFLQKKLSSSSKNASDNISMKHNSGVFTINSNISSNDRFYQTRLPQGTLESNNASDSNSIPKNSSDNDSIASMQSNIFDLNDEISKNIYPKTSSPKTKGSHNNLPSLYFTPVKHADNVYGDESNPLEEAVDYDCTNKKKFSTNPLQPLKTGNNCTKVNGEIIQDCSPDTGNNHFKSAYQCTNPDCQKFILESMKFITKFRGKIQEMRDEIRDSGYKNDR
ncbi:hypothetical protein CWI38_0686p0020 [Hamiltosporidium tvaerminnensis]|uniref:Uncharacterized protein n=1 Tax=Hamiltosporidium tvaerminnensis TaxID=1176355 RepID=A0A4Q9LWA2_9MICR|nr:hypothetical protein CWI38_0686p0020 [Hamiltosporidium tvaerminnensis]